MAKKSNNRMILAAVCLLVAVGVLFFAWRALAPKGTAGQKQITVEVVHGDGSSKAFTLDTQQENLGPALVEQKIVEDNQGAYGLYILTADGETADESKQQWWKITKSGEKLTTGADATPIADGEHYELTLTTGYND